MFIMSTLQGTPFFIPILVWSPVEQYNGVLLDGFTCPRCDSSSILYRFGWMNGIGRNRLQPMRIHGRDSVTILVGRIYKCMKSGHEIVGYHSGILRQHLH